MATTTKSSDVLQMELKTKQICRFCLIQQQDKLGSIYQRDSRLKSSAPLPVQVMACASIEVFSNDGMPSWVCSDCRLLFEHAYRFKQMCKRAEMLLRQFPLTGQWPIPLAKPKFPKELMPSTPKASTQQVKQDTANKPSPSATNKIKKGPEVPRPKKLLNVDPAESPEPPTPTRLKKEKLDLETTNFLNKVDNNEELSIDDVHRLIAASEEDEQIEFLECESVASQPPIQAPMPTKVKQKLLNKSSIRILNKDAEIVLEPRLSAPQLKRDVDGNMAIVTEILSPQTSYGPESDSADPVKDVVPVETIVFPCPHCERSFPLRQLRDIHMVNHTRSRSFQCPDCEKSFFSKYDLQKHTLIHTGDRPFKCTVCDKTFTRSTLLHRHEKTHTDIPKFICIYCEKPFISKEQMEKHTERHIKNRPYQCSLCKKSFAFKQGLERHEVIHSREQPYPCQYCDQSFSTPSKLARHLTAHAGKRPYPCKFCPKSYLLSHHLTRHLRSHRYGTVTFMCSDCDKMFKTRDELIYHSAVHATQTLVCPLCKETFRDIQSVTAHIKEHADGDAFACEFCDLIFMTAERLQQHTDADHAGDMIAYHQDDEQTQRLQNETVKKSESEEKNDSKNSEIMLLEETIEEFLVDDLAGETETLSEAKVVSVSDIKEESEWTNQSSDQPHILNQIVFHSKSKLNDDDDILVLDENIVEANEAVDVVDEDDMPLRPPPAKVRKIINQRTRQIVKSNEPETTSKQQKNTSPQTRRKVAEAAQQASTQREIKIEKDTIVESNPTKTEAIQNVRQTSINSYLKMLPKGVSVRRNNPSNNEKNTSDGKPPLKTSPTQGKQKETRSSGRSSNEGSPTVAVKKIQSPNETSNSKNKEQPIKRSATATESNKSGSSVDKFPGTTKTMKMMIGDKKVKVQKITLTKAEAAAMTKDGRIRMKDGNMVLTKISK